MKKTVKAAPSARDAERDLKRFVDKFYLKDQTLIRAVRKALRRRFPTAYELVYDNYNFLVIGYSPTERPSDAIVSMAAGAKRSGFVLYPWRESSRSEEDTSRIRQSN